MTTTSIHGVTFVLMNTSWRPTPRHEYRHKRAYDRRDSRKIDRTDPHVGMYGVSRGVPSGRGRDLHKPLMNIYHHDHG